MTYSVKEIFYTLQGEGRNAGRAAVFCRFAGCNLWSGRERDRAAAVCTFCDTDFVGTDGPGGGRFADADALARKLRGIMCHVNLIPLNPVPERGLNGVTRAEAERFAARLTERNISATVRREMGTDIEGACGQLRRRILHEIRGEN